MKNARNRYRAVFYFGLVSAGLILAVSVSARVFRVIGARAEGVLNTAGLPWDSAYQTRMTVNGRKSSMHLYSARYTEPVLAQLTSRFEAQGAVVTMQQTATSATGHVQWPDREAGFLVLSPEDQPRHLIYLYYPDAGSRPGPVYFPVAEYPRGDILTSASDDDMGTHFLTMQTPDSALDVQSFYAGVFSDGGWGQILSPRIEHGLADGMAIYKKEKKICYVQASERPGQPNIITLLVRSGVH